MPRPDSARAERPSRRAEVSHAAPLFAALGDETRLRLMTRLCTDGPQSIARLSDGAAVTRQAITKHLQALAAAGLVQSERDGRERLWRAETKRLREVRRLLDQISEQWDGALQRLQAAVEEHR